MSSKRVEKITSGPRYIGKEEMEKQYRKIMLILVTSFEYKSLGKVFSILFNLSSMEDHMIYLVSTNKFLK